MCSRSGRPDPAIRTCAPLAGHRGARSGSARRAACRPVSDASTSPASTPIICTASSKGWNRPMALEPPPHRRSACQAGGPSAPGTCGLTADHALQVADDHRVWMWPQRRAQQIVAVANTGGQSRSASLMASLSVRDESTGHLGAQQAHTATLGAWRAMSSVPMYTTQSMPSSAAQWPRRRHVGQRPSRR